MGLIQAAVGSIGGALADQWKDFYTVPQGLPATAALFAAVPQGTNAGRGSNTRGSSNIITNGSKIVRAPFISARFGYKASDCAILEQQQPIAFWHDDL